MWFCFLFQKVYQSQQVSNRCQSATISTYSYSPKNIKVQRNQQLHQHVFIGFCVGLSLEFSQVIIQITFSELAIGLSLKLANFVNSFFSSYK